MIETTKWSVRVWIWDHISQTYPHKIWAISEPFAKLKQSPRSYLMRLDYKDD